MPKISVIVPCYNVEKYIARCIDSVRQQVLQDIEIICVDDHSSDGTLRILNNLQAFDARICVIAQQENRGVSVARNLALERASGDYVAFIDGDDFLPDNDVLYDMYTAAKKNKVKICGGSILFCNSDATDFISNSAENVRFMKNGLMSYKDWPYDYGFTRFIYDRQWLIDNKILFPAYVRQEDPVFFVKAMCSAGQFYALRRATYVYRVNYKSVKYTDRVLIDTFCGIHDCLCLARENDMWDLYKNIARHTNDFAGCLSKKASKKLCEVVGEVTSMLCDEIPNDFVPAKQLLRILRKFNKQAYNRYTKSALGRKRIYIFGFLPLIRISCHRLYTDVKLFDVFLLFRVYHDSHSRMFCLLGILPVFKIKE